MSTSSDQIAALRAEIVRTRADLGATAEALAAKTDIKARAKESAADMRARARESATAMKERFRGSAQGARDGAQPGRDRPRGLALAGPAPGAPATVVGDRADMTGVDPAVNGPVDTGSGRMSELSGRARDMGGRAVDAGLRMKGTLAHPDQWSDTTKRRVIPLAGLGVAVVAGGIAGLIARRRRR